uniref:Pyrin domain-containing protein n=1 Tax=Lates calcarifer TaxID=8187 RepID=A0A4W6BZK1_LATCA
MSFDFIKQILLETLNGLSHKELKKYKWFLQFSYFKRGLPQIPWSQLEKADRAELVDLMMEMCDQQSVEVTREVFMDMNRTDLVQRLSETSSGLGVNFNYTKKLSLKEN